MGNDYTPRLMEMTSWSREKESQYLIVKYKWHDTSVKFRWDIDRTTFDSLMELIEQAGRTCRFQLSFRTSWNSEGNHYISYLSVILNGEIARFPFKCSSEYAENLKWLAELKDLDELKVNQEIRDKNSTSANHTPTPPNKKRSKLLVALISVAGVSFLSFFMVAQQSVFSQQPKQQAHYHSQNQISTAILQKKQKVIWLASARMDSNTINEIARADTENQESEAFLRMFNVDEGKVALTFDDGPSIYTEEIVEILDRHNVKASFFFVGNRVKDYKDSVKLVQERGYTIGIHGHTHKLLTALSKQEQKEEILNAKKAVEDVTGEAVRYFRAPYGGYNQYTLEILKEQNLHFVQWNQDLEDWGAEGIEVLLQRLHQSNPSGGIYVLHETAVTVEALDDIIQYLKDQGLILVGL